MSSTLAGAFGIAALFVAVLALVFAIQALRAQTGAPKTAQKLPATPVQTVEQPEPQPQEPQRPGTVKSELRRLSKELEDARNEMRETLQHLAVVRYDAYGDMGGRLSWSMALLDDNGDGVDPDLDQQPERRPLLRQGGVRLRERVQALAGGGRGDRDPPQGGVTGARRARSPLIGDPDHR